LTALRRLAALQVATILLAPWENGAFRYCYKRAARTRDGQWRHQDRIGADQITKRRIILIRPYVSATKQTPDWGSAWRTTPNQENLFNQIKS
jgi:hypothetical protein